MPPSSSAENVGRALFEIDQSKGYVDIIVKSITPMFIGAGLGAFVPFISPLIIAVLANHLLPKALKVAGGKIEIAQEQLQKYEKEGGSKAILARVFSPSLRVLKKVIPYPEKELHEALSEGSSKLKEFFSAILKDDTKKKKFEDNLQQLIN